MNCFLCINKLKHPTIAGKKKLENVFLLKDEQKPGWVYGSVISSHRSSMKTRVWSPAQNENSYLTKQGKSLIFRNWKMWDIVYHSYLYVFISHHCNKYPRKINKENIYFSLTFPRLQSKTAFMMERRVGMSTSRLPILFHPLNVAVHIQAV